MLQDANLLVQHGANVALIYALHEFKRCKCHDKRHIQHKTEAAIQRFVVAVDVVFIFLYFHCLSNDVINSGYVIYAYDTPKVLFKVMLATLLLTFYALSLFDVI